MHAHTQDPKHEQRHLQKSASQTPIPAPRLCLEDLASPTPKPHAGMCTQMACPATSRASHPFTCVCTQTPPPKEGNGQINSSPIFCALNGRGAPKGLLELSVVSANGLGQHPQKKRTCPGLCGGVAMHIAHVRDSFVGMHTCVHV